MKKSFFKKSIRNRILLGILTVPALSVLIFIPWSLNFIDRTALKQAQEKVEFDLNSARVIYNGELYHLSRLILYQSLRTSITNEIFSGNPGPLKKELDKLKDLEKVDILLATDNKGRVVARAGISEVQGDDLSKDKLISRALKGQRVQSTDLLPLARLAREGGDLAERACIQIIPTPQAKPKPRPTRLNSGMVLAAAQPVMADGKVAGTLYTAQLLNRNFDIVDKTRDTVYKDRLYKGRMVGTSTIFQGEVRISTNVQTKDGRRAIGTCISAEVGEACLEKGERWIGRAFVVHDWYITAYEPIYDLDKKIIGILYVGTLESPYVGLKDELFTQIVLFVIGITPFGVLISIFVSKKIVRPIKELAAATEKIAEGDYTRRAIIESPDEVGMLASSFNRMAESIQAKTEALNEAQKSLYNYSKNLEELVIERTERLLATEMRYTNLFEIANDAFFTIDRNYIVTSINSYGENLTGYSRKDIVGKMQLLDVIHADDRDIVKNKIDRVRSGQALTAGMSFRIKDKNETEKIVEMNMSVAKGGGSGTEILGIARDVTERRKLEEDVSRTRDELQVLFNSITDGIDVVDRDYNVIKANEGMARQRGIPVQDMIGRKCYEIFYKRQKPCEGCVVEETFKTGKTYVKTRERTRSNGTVVSADVFTFPIFDHEGRVIQVVEYSRDLTERRQLEQQLLQAQKMETVGVLAGGIAHDFNNLLSGILGYASLLKTRTREGEPLYKYADTIEQSAVKAARLTQQLLTFSRGDKSRTEPVNINKIAEETLQILERTIDRSIRIHKEFSPDIWAMEADPSQMEQVLLNICINARDAMPTGGILTIKTENVTLNGEPQADYPETGTGNYVKITISDTGTGIARDIRHKIFDPFFSTKDKRKGTGLGLSVVYGVVKNHGGVINLKSEPMEGTSFEIYIPASTNIAAPSDSAASVKESRGGHENILLVDDEEVVRDLGREVLESYGYKVIPAADGIEAVSIYEKQKDGIDLIILDMIMPRMGGIETFERLQAIDPTVKVIVSSGYSSDGHYQAVVQKGAKGFIQKPYKIDELTGMVRHVLDES
ncbi:MAG: PAS domain S-box protein [Thermodesulfobacteriota bacterium]